MKQLSTVLLRLLAVLVPAGLGILAIVFSGALAQAPAGKEKEQPATPVRVITLEPQTVLPRVTGYGTVMPAREWRAIARIDGEVTETSPLLANGNMAPAGTLLLKIDDTDLRLSLAQTDAQLAALDVKDETLNASLGISRSDLDLSQADLDRQTALRDQGVATKAALDQARRAVLSARAKTTEIENQLALNKAERSVLTAQRAIAERNLDFTTIKAPYDLRIGTVSAEIGQVVTRGATLLAGDGTEAAEIAAQFPIGRMGPIIRSMSEGGSAMQLNALVRLPVPGHVAEWKAEVARVAESMDARTQSAQIVVRIDDPQGKAQPGIRPPLRRNMFVEVELSAPAMTSFVIPAQAIQDGKVLVVTAQNTLAAKDIEPAFTIEDIAIVSDGLSAGDRIVVTDPAIVVPGMAVRPVEDDAVKAHVAAIAGGSEGRP
ncbi:hypothetical protein CSC94_05075 [Zhengella mangrovi]|uniref:Multidrug resistance protein MdtA-like C-terminal permuted SH3 domain-containing protein n=1 Tax=Zhengella mangrovi TaxID=1982044 RepID=A0A2G1QRC8_9HYPH|nr:efflux RND transporter periplasmic adaptor subunit [Zhengella mangrovi]PHP68039.1 hypothetical protein CSC94_05075 [Zhengella mangrovi]